jgi:cell wall-associated NlpC family hydrolase
MTNEDEGRTAVDRVAREWIGTPFHDLGEVKGLKGGVDCAKLIKCVFRDAGVIPDFEIEHYSPQHFLHSGEEKFLGYVTRFAHEIQPERVQTGDVALYKIGKAFAHGAIVISPGWPNIVHAHYGARIVRRGFGTSVHLGQPILAIKFFSFW